MNCVGLVDLLIKAILVLFSSPFEIRWRCYCKKYLVGRECPRYLDGAEVESATTGTGVGGLKTPRVREGEAGKGGQAKESGPWYGPRDEGVRKRSLPKYLRAREN